MRARIEGELALLRRHFDVVEHVEHAGEDWFRIGTYSYPAGWRTSGDDLMQAPVVFKVGPAYPTSEPYGFYGPGGLNYRGKQPGNPGSGPPPPFAGTWQHLSWAPDGSWAPTADVEHGSNLLSWARSFSQRLREGA